MDESSLDPLLYPTRGKEEFLTCANDHTSPSHHCVENKLPGNCSFVGCQLLEKVRLTHDL